ncbi:unnamed protein product [Caenorhabditis sp. 36 PRJEB53466]|nr:unnamed protein product [Caenorhabditis sp. 36 PRJEB53466]
MYTISWISVKGGCSEHGTLVDSQHIPSRELEAEIWNPTIVLKFLILFEVIIRIRLNGQNSQQSTLKIVARVTNRLNLGLDFDGNS